MKRTLGISVLLMAAAPVAAHRLDEYLQATLISVEKDHIEAQIRLTPGVMVLPLVLGNIDTDADGLISDAEQRAYADRVLHDFSMTIDGDRVPLHLVSSKFPNVEEMKQGLGELQFEFTARVPDGGSKRRLLLENHHQSRISAYLVNSLVPRDPDLRITAQNRNYQQSSYELLYEQAGARAVPPLLANFSGAVGWLSIPALLLLARLVFLWRH